MAGNLVALALYSLMPSLLKWNYLPGIAEDELPVEQRVFPGDMVIYDGEQGRIDKLDGALAHVEFGAGEDRVINKVACSLVQAVASRDPRPERESAGKHARPGPSSQGLAALFGLSPVVEHKPTNSQPKNAKGLGKTVKRKQPAATEPTADEQPAEQHPSGAFEIGAEHAAEDVTQDATEEEPAAAKRSKKVGVRQMDAKEMAAYKHKKYVGKQQGQQEAFLVEFKRWLAKDDAHGAHCAVCIKALSKPMDKLSTTGYGWTGEGDARAMVPIPSRQKLTAHAAKPRHKYNVDLAAARALGKSAASTTGDTAMYMTITSEDELYMRTIRTVHVIAIRQLSLNDMATLLELQHANGMIISFDHAAQGGDVDGGLATWLLAGRRVFQAQQRDRATSTLATTIFPRGVPFSFMGDGSNDRSLVEQEAVVTRWLSGEGKPYNQLHDLAPLDLSTSADGRSPDADCIATCYASSLKPLGEFTWTRISKGEDGSEVHTAVPLIHGGDWKKAGIGGSFDGASVMLGSQKGVAKKLQDLSETTLAQLANGDSFSSVPYYEEWRGVVQEVFVHYAQSGKKRFGLEEVANELGVSLLKISSTRGIRWADSQAKTIKALTTDLPAVVEDLQVTVKRELGLCYTLLTASSLFLNKTFSQTFQPEGGGRAKTWKARVLDFTESPDGRAANDTFIIIYSDKTQVSMSKSELVSRLTDLSNEKLTGDSRWQLRDKLTDWLFNGFSAFMLDVHEQCAILSKSYQSNTLIIFDVSKNLNKTLRALDKLKVTPGPGEKAFLEAVSKDDDADVLHTCQLFDGADGRVKLKEYRVDIITSLSDFLTTRFSKVLENPFIKAMAVFDFRKWPLSKPLLQDFGGSNIELLYDAYACFVDETETKEKVLEQWSDLKNEIADAPGLLSLKFHELWARMLVQYADEYTLVLRLVVFMLLLPCDTSECERIFSLMNDLKTAERNRLGQENLRNLMVWHMEGKSLPCAQPQVLVLAILKEFRQLAGIRGRSMHRPTMPPKYEFKVKVELDGEPAPTPAPALAPAPAPA